MNHLFSKQVMGVSLLVIGVALCAAFGAKLSPRMFTYSKEQAKLAATSHGLKKRFDTYLAVRAEAKLPPFKKPDFGAAAFLQMKTKKERDAHAQAYLKVLSDLSDHGGVSAERDAWLEYERLVINLLPAAPLPSPRTRLSGWALDSGMPFALGIALIIVGSFIYRRSNKSTVSDSGQFKSSTLDLRTTLKQFDELSEKVMSLSSEAQSIKTPTLGDATRIKLALEALQLSHIQPIVEHRAALQERIGLASFADVFAPFSSGERNLNRAWATLVDQHWPECLASLGRAAISLRRANDILKNSQKA